jgi:AcrR family transcriptional regulator
VRDIAADVGLKNQASLYHYYSHKQALYEAVLTRGVEGLLPLWEGAGDEIASSAATDGAATVATYLDRVIEHLVAHPHLARLIERAGLDEDEYVRATVRSVLQPLYAAGLRVLQDAGGSWQPSELPHVAAGIYHLIFGYFANAGLLHAVLDEDPHSPEMLARQRRFLTNAIARLLAVNGDGGAPRAIK